jgi:hypothetical protein
MTLDPEELTQLNFVIDAITAKPERANQFLSVAGQQTGEFRKAIGVLRSVLAEERPNLDGLQKGAERLARARDDVSQVVGQTIMRSIEARKTTSRRIA